MSVVANDLKQRAERCRKVIDNLEHNEGFRVMIEDFSNNLKSVNDSWHMIPHSEYNKLVDLRIQKFAALAVLNVIDNYKHDLKASEKQLYEIEHPEEVQGGYYDHE